MTCMVLAYTPRQHAVRCLTTSAGKKSIVGIRPSNRSGADTSSVETLSTGLQPVERFMRQPLAYYAVVELSASIDPELVTDIMSASRLDNVSRNVVHRDLMPRELPNRSSIYLLVLVYRLRPAPCRLIKRERPARQRFCRLLLICNVASAMTHVQRQR